MGSMMLSLIMLCVLAYTFASDETTKPPISSGTRLGRTGRKNYVWQPPSNYGDDGDDSTDDGGPDPSNGTPPQVNDFPGFGNFKGYDQFSNFAPPRYPPFVPNYKGYPSYPTFWKGGQPGNGASTSVGPDQLMNMMMSMNSMDDSSKPGIGGILSSLVSDPKSVAAAAIIPLSIVAAAVVPVIMNYMMTGMSTPIVSTTATNNKDARSLDVSNSLDMLLESISKFSRSMDGDDCIQKTICKVAAGDSNMSVPDYIKKAATTVAHLVKEDWVNNLGVKTLFDGVKQGNCDNVCSDSKLASGQL